MRKNFDIPSIRARLAGKSGKDYWRSLEEIAETDEFQDLLKHEFPQGTDQWLDPIGRRNFLKLMAASLALGGLAACSPRPQEEIVAPVEGIVEYTALSEPLHYATAFELGGVAMGVLAQSNIGRPTKIDGNPDHPASLGSSDAFTQATLLEMYDPDRAQNVTNAGTVVTWNTFTQELTLFLEGQSATSGAGLRILTETVSSPSLHNQLQAVLEAYPEARWYQYEPVNRDNARAGAQMAFGEDVNAVYDFSQADVIVSLDANFMTDGPGRVRYSKDFSDKRRIRTEGIEVKHGEVVGGVEPHEAQLDALTMNRLYMVETTPSPTGTLADHRLPLSSAQIEGFARMLAAALGVSVDAPDSVEGVPDDWISAIAEDLQATGSNALVIPGAYQSPVVHALAHAMNEALGSVGTTVTYTDPLEAEPTNQVEGLRELVDDMNAGNVEMLIIIDANPVYNAPADIDFAAAMDNIPFRVRMGLYEDETSALCQWNVARKHYLEAWGDSRAYDGTVSIIQPLIQPLYDDHSPIELIGAMLPDTAGTPDYDLVRTYWEQESSTGDNFNDVWRDALFMGAWPDSALPAKSVSVSLSNMPAYEPGEGLEITFRPDPSIWDGRFANNGWLQELPKPTSKLTWDNVATISPALAEAEGISVGDMLRLEFDGRSVLAPAWIQPGQALNSVTITLGYGRERVGRVGDNVGVSAFRLLTTDNYWMGQGLELLNTGEEYVLASTQSHYSLEGRDFVREGTLEMFKENPAFSYVQHEVSTDLSLLEGWEYNSYMWGMAVDLNLCNGCNACVVACQAENNIPIVGKDQVIAGREMHWMRIDTYFNGELDNPSTMSQPMMCQHCEQAPCELVCPVNATVHDAEGLNVMVYNRCIGTRYCSNNCPYKVRRFNFLYYNNNEFNSDITLHAMRNPQVTVRTRGVMEKCTYCLQRISDARINAKVEGRRIADGEVVTACQSACPTNAIVFGDTNDPNTAVSKAKKQPQKYGVLTELGTRPQTSYMTRLKNLNPAIEGTSVVIEPHDG